MGFYFLYYNYDVFPKEKSLSYNLVSENIVAFIVAKFRSVPIAFVRIPHQLCIFFKILVH